MENLERGSGERQEINDLPRFRPNISISTTVKDDAKAVLSRQSSTHSPSHSPRYSPRHSALDSPVHRDNWTPLSNSNVSPLPTGGHNTTSSTPTHAYVTISGQTRLFTTLTHGTGARYSPRLHGASCITGSAAREGSGSKESSVRSIMRNDNDNTSQMGSFAGQSLSSGFENLRNLSDINNIVHHPLSAGFLFKFCESQYCAENIKYIIEIDKLADYFYHDFKAFSSKPWKAIDMDLHLVFECKSSDMHSSAALEAAALIKSGELIPEVSWPSIVVDRKVVLEKVRYIWETFLCDEAESQICMSSSVFSRILTRLRYLHLYGAQAFQESLQDPVKTIHRDIKPRFMTSDEFRELQLRMEDLSELPCAATYRMPPPPPVVHLRYTPAQMKKTGFEYTIEDCMEDALLYAKFLKFLNRSINSENLRFLRSVAVFQEKISSDKRSEQAEGRDLAWIILQYFIAPTSAFEISISHAARRQVMRHMARPTYEMFDDLVKPTLQLLRVHFESFRKYAEFKELPALVLESLPQRIKQQKADAQAAKAAAKKSASAGNGNSSSNLKSSSSLSRYIACFGGAGID